MERLDKLLVSQGVGTRKEVQKLIKSKGITVDGICITKPDAKVNPHSTITVRGQALSVKKHIYIMLNKPQGVVSATEDKNCKTVIDILPDNLKRPGLFPAGRLDKDTEGLLIITDDGDFAHRMLSPKKHVVKRYYAELDGEISNDMIKAFEKGIIFRDGTKCLPASLKKAQNNSGFVEISEGKFHQVKKMFAVCGLNVTFLKRIAIGNLKLDDKLPIGNARELTKFEESAIFVVN